MGWVPFSCAVDAGCQDAVGSPGLGWLAVPALIVAVLVAAVIVYYAVVGGRGIHHR